MPRLTPRLLRAALAAVVTGCASGGSSSGTATSTPERVELSGSSATLTRTGSGSSLSMQVNRADNGEVTSLPVPTDSVWPALVQAYDAVGIVPNTAISAQGRIALLNGSVRRQLGKTWLSQYLSCGSDAVGVPHADAYDVVLNVDSRITPNGPTGSQLTTLVTAQAHSPAASGITVSCGSTGLLESRVAADVHKRLVR